MNNRQRISVAVQDETWQAFRRSLLNTSTRHKLDRLKEYLEKSQDVKMDRLRVDNYLKALCRTGLLHPGLDLVEMEEDNWSSNWIKRESNHGRLRTR